MLIELVQKRYVPLALVRTRIACMTALLLDGSTLLGRNTNLTCLNFFVLLLTMFSLALSSQNFWDGGGRGLGGLHY